MGCPGSGPVPQPYSAPAGAPGPGMTAGAQRRSIGAAVVELLLAVLWLLVSFAAVSQIAVGVGGVVGWAILFGWLLSGPVVLVRPVEMFIARVLLRLRRPTEAERQRIDGPWSAVLAVAGVNPNTYSLWIQDVDRLNAVAGVGRIVGVTRRSVSTLQPPHLSAVLAHELGHHRSAAPWLSLLVWWYAAPGKLAVRGAAAVLGSAIGVLARVRLSVLPRVAFALALSIAILAAVSWVLGPASLVLFLLVVPRAYLARLDEFRADRFAVKLGFGHQLTAVLKGCLSAGYDGDRRTMRRHHLTLATRPPLSARVVALERRGRR